MDKKQREGKKTKIDKFIKIQRKNKDIRKRIEEKDIEKTDTD